ncbi:MAG: glycoside hydrolase family 127 protein [Nocardioidaceae bacterium]|nr:glycoside hydrolase family 127 protein [Nocardioidaceae bacterium]
MVNVHADPPVRGPVAPTADARAATSPLPLSEVRLTRGFWADRQRVNRTASLPIGSSRLRDAGNLENLRLAADPSGARGPDAYHGPVFMDSDVHKWLEAVCWEIAREPSAELREEIEVFSRALDDAQADDGYLNSYVQVVRGDDRYRDLVMGHEHYCLGHLLQAAVAAHRALGDCLLWQVGLRAADHLVKTFGPDAHPGIDGHPVVEMALVELYRETGEHPYLELARHFISTRGRSTLTGYGREPIYFSDRVPVATTTSPEGHAVRAVYLAAGASDVAAEDAAAAAELDDALETQWRSMVEQKQYLTGGLGSRWDGEAFGDPYELPPDVAYAETCASIGAVQWAWRRLLATGDVGYADGIERLLLNGFACGVSLSGEEFFYVNALQVRADAVPHDHRHPVNGRQGWFRVACCPPNVMRTLAQLGGYLASGTADTLVLHQYAAAELEHDGWRLHLDTDYPWDGEVTITVDEVPDDTERTLTMRVPAWCTDATVTDPDGQVVAAAPGYVSVRRGWHPGDAVRLALPMPVRLTPGHPRVDAVRGCLAVERGPLVYAVEQLDLPEGPHVDDLRLTSTDPSALVAEPRPDLLGGCVVVTGDVADGAGGTGRMVAVPYCLWANREVGPMRVWIPVAEPAS